MSACYSKPGAARYTVQRLNNAYAVLTPEGRSAEVGIAFKAEAERRRDALQRLADQAAKRGPRACMCCGNGFPSDGVHNRLCDGCRRRNDASLPAGFPARRRTA